MFIENRYSQKYFSIINHALDSNRRRSEVFNQLHHIVPRCMGGTDNDENLVLLTYKEHRVCHCLLIKMVSSKNFEIKLRHAYGWFNKTSRFNGPRYKLGAENVFATSRIKIIVRERMLTNNPMKNPEIVDKMLKSRANTYKIRPKPRGKLRLKYITPFGTFQTKKQIIAKGIPEWTCNRIFSDLDGFPEQTNKRSKKSLFIADPNKSWREQGFGLIEDDRFPVA